MTRPLVRIALLAACIASTLASCATTREKPPALLDGARARVAILETTDLHSNVLSYDYFKLAEDPTLGFERVATLIKAARLEFENALLFDDGDTIQGTPLADLQARTPPACGEEIAMYAAMDAIGYDGGTIGNHEFNYGLAYLSRATGTPMNVDGVSGERCKGPHFPLVLANVVSARDDKPIYRPYAIVEKTIHARNADDRAFDVKLRIGIVGFTPPPIMQWDRTHLEGKVRTLGLVEAAQRYVPELRAKGVDLVVAISHGGLDAAPYSPTLENANLYLADVPGIDVLLLGHSHTVFPDPTNAASRFNGLANVDNERGFVHGKPAVMGDFWGKSLGVIDLALVRRDGAWQVDAQVTHSEVRHIKDADGRAVAPDPLVAQTIAKQHAATIAYVSTPIGTTDFELSSHFVDVGDVSAIEAINLAQRDYAARYIAANLPAERDVPLVSAASAFRDGFGGASDYTDVPAGPVAIRDAAALYLYPNLIAAVKTDGAGVRAWLEHAAGFFNRIDPALRTPQKLVNAKFSSYNFDILQGDLTYAIDVTQPVGQRIRDLAYKGKPIEAAQPFIVVTNSYRASGGGHFPGVDGRNVLFSAPDANRDVLIEWLRAQRTLTRATHASDRNWRFVPVRTAGTVEFTSAAGKLELARAARLDGVTLVRDNGDGKATYAIDLNAAAKRDASLNPKRKRKNAR